MKSFTFLKSGDTIGIVAPARKITLEEINPAIQVIESWGLKVTIGKTIGKEYHQFAGTDEERLQDFQEMLDNQNIKAIFCARGGYGTVRIIDLIDFRKFIKNPKWIVGFSDITILHAHLEKVYNIASIHSIMPINFPESIPEALESLRKALFGEPLFYKIQTHQFNRIGQAEGVLVGGNLSLIHTLMGTPSEIDTTDKILFIEDLDEYLYHIDRMLINLKRSGKLEHLAGLIVGGLTKMKDNDIPFGKTAEEIIREHVEEYEYPICFDFPAGHIPDNRALIIGKKVQLNVSDNESILDFKS